ncbi:serine/arginine repetitive matrix 1, isoform CRA_b [Mus musculus]|nr:serine/arginine repetitive matrix 1, isoform CRA_b [Mus musculus]
MDAGFFRGTSAEQDNRFSNKQKKLLKQLKFAECLEKKVDMSKVNLEVIKPWITKRVTEILGFEDDVVIEFIFNQLEAVTIATPATAAPAAVSAATTTSAQEEPAAAPEPRKETESEAEDDNLDDLERHLREKALRSMRKAQVSPQS